MTGPIFLFLCMPGNVDISHCELYLLGRGMTFTFLFMFLSFVLGCSSFTWKQCDFLSLAFKVYWMEPE